MKSCKQKYELQQRDLPKNMRRSADKIIASYNANNAMLRAGGNYDMDAMNNQAFDVYEKYIDENTLAVNISRLREKVGSEHIKTIRGLGYRYEE